jgi:hypothetical protein
MAAESKTGCFLNFPKKSLSGPALPPPDGRAFCCPHDAYGQVEK